MKRDFSEEQKWTRSKIRPLFITKDHNLQGDEEGVDIREETGLDNTTGNLYYRFYKKYLMLAYGLFKISQRLDDREKLQRLKDAMSIDELTDKAIMDVFHSEFAVARMNLKKIAGNSACSDAELQITIDRDFDFIKKQIALYSPNVIVCCHGKNYAYNPIMQMLLKLYPDLKKQVIEGYNCQFIYWSEQERTIVLHEWHPSYWAVSYSDYFEAIPQLVDCYLKTQVEAQNK